MRSPGENSRARGGVILGFLLLAVPSPSLQAPEPMWPSGLAPDDRGAIIELAEQVGMGRLQVVVAYNLGHDDLCPMVRVESRPVVDGKRVLSQQLWMRREKGLGCSRVPLPRRPIRHRNWLTNGLPRQVERSRFTDGGWHVDVFLGDKVTYTDAATIVRAIRRTELVDRRSSVKDRRPLSGLDASQIMSIKLGDSDANADADGPHIHEVAFSNHAWVRVVIVAGVVELHTWGMWQA